MSTTWRPPGMRAQELARTVHEIIKQYGVAEISQHELLRTFRQEERKTPVGAAICTLAGIPDEKASYERWLAANNWNGIIKATDGNVLIFPREVTR